jgi:hypothetical protein
MLKAELFSWKYSKFTLRLREYNSAFTGKVAHTAELYYTNIVIALNFRTEHTKFEHTTVLGSETNVPEMDSFVTS